MTPVLRNAGSAPAATNPAPAASGPVLKVSLVAQDPESFGRWLHIRLGAGAARAVANGIYKSIGRVDDEFLPEEDLGDEIELD